MPDVIRIFPLIALLLAGCGGDEEASLAPEGGSRAQSASGSEPYRPQVAADTLYNREAVIPPQCYTKTEGTKNPCYTCHQSYDDVTRPNKMDDGFLQGDYGFSDVGVENHWKNLFVDRRDEVAAISDEAITDYIQSDNYTAFINGLKNDPDWSGPVPAIDGLAEGAAAFDNQGLALDGSGWVAFNYKPLPSTFWPTNGSIDDVMIRLPKPFRTASCATGTDAFSRDAYFANLAVLEMAMKDLSTISTPPIDENAVCEDLNDDGVLTMVQEIPARDHYLGDAASEPVARMSYPEGTQFIHTVRYVGLDNGKITPSRRMKEVRYMKKVKAYSTPALASLYGNERQEKMEGMLPTFVDHGDKGLNNGLGWEVLGFIEDSEGELRKQTYQEQMFCMGCHGTIGTTIDQTFAFPRKVTGAEGWGYINFEGMKDAPSVGETEPEILQYLERVGGGNEFRANPEMRDRWFLPDGTVDESAVRGADVYTLITPSPGRALSLNKAYRVIVQEQSFAYGRDATITPVRNVFRSVDPEAAPPLEESARIDHWDLRLAW